MHADRKGAGKAVKLRPGVFRPDLSVVTTAAAAAALDGRVEARPTLIGKWLHELTLEEDRVWRAVLILYGRLGRAPALPEIGADTGLQETEARRLLERLAQYDLLALDGAGGIRHAYPFAEDETGHRVVLGKHTFNALCAIDALGAGEMYESDIRVQSECRYCGEAVEITTALRGKKLGSIVPAGSVVWYDFAYSDSAAASCCPAIAFFCSEQHLQLWLNAGSADRNGMRLSLPEAFEVGRAIFGPILRAGAN